MHTTKGVTATSAGTPEGAPWPVLGLPKGSGKWTRAVLCCCWDTDRGRKRKKVTSVLFLHSILPPLPASQHPAGQQGRIGHGVCRAQSQRDRTEHRRVGWTERKETPSTSFLPITAAWCRQPNSALR